MKYCTKCGAELTPNVDICGNCGCPVPGANIFVMREKGLQQHFKLILGIFVAVIVLCAVSFVAAPEEQPIPTASISFGDFTTVGFTIDNPRNAQSELNSLRREFEREHERLINLPDDPKIEIGNLEISGLLEYKSEYQTRFDDFTERVADWANSEVSRKNNIRFTYGCTAFFAVVIAAVIATERGGFKLRREKA